LIVLFKGKRIRKVTVKLREKNTLAKKTNEDQVEIEKKKNYFLKKKSLR